MNVKRGIGLMSGARGRGRGRRNTLMNDIRVVLYIERLRDLEFNRVGK